MEDALRDVRNPQSSILYPLPSSFLGGPGALAALALFLPGRGKKRRKPHAAPAAGKAMAAPWFAAARLRLEAVRSAADELPLAPDLRGTVAARVIRARNAVDASAAGPDAAAAAKAVDDVMAGLQADVNGL